MLESISGKLLCLQALWETKYGTPWKDGIAQGDEFLNGPAPTKADILIEDSNHLNPNDRFCTVQYNQCIVECPLDVRHNVTTNVQCVFPCSRVLIVQEDAGGIIHEELHEVQSVSGQGTKFTLTHNWKEHPSGGQPPKTKPLRQAVKVFVRGRHIRDENTGQYIGALAQAEALPYRQSKCSAER